MRALLAMVMGVWIGTAALHDRGVRPPPAYVVAEIEVTDRATMQEYGQRVPETLLPFDYRYVVRGGETTALEGDPPKGMVVIGFDSAAEARRWYESEAYAAIKPIRQRAAKSRIFVVEGVGR